MRKTVWLIVLLAFCRISVYAQYYFGRNKVQYHQFQWHILKTEHFDVFYYPEMKDLAEIGAYYAEDAYQRLQDRFNHHINRRIPLVFYSSHFHFQETNTLPYMIPQGLGGFFEFIKGRVVIPSDGTLSKFSHTIRHELVHVFERSVRIRAVRDYQPGRYAAVPLWFTEGLAEFWSDGWDEEAEMVIRDGVLNNTLVPVTQLWRIQGSYLMYKEGQAILKYISETYGDYKIRQILDNLWRAETFSAVLEITLGIDAKQLNEDWMYALKKQMYPLMDKGDLPSGVSRPVTQDGYNTLPCFYRNGDGRMVIFVANRDGYTSIYRQLLKPGVTEPDAEIVIQGEKTPDMESLHLQRSRMDVSPDGRLAFTAKSGPGDVLYIYDLSTETFVYKFRDSSLVSILSPAWSPDAGKIAFCALDPSGRQDLYVFSLDRFEVRRLTLDYNDEHDPDWSPDGRLLVFSSNRSEGGDRGYTHLHLLDTETGRVRQLTSGDCHDRQPAWSPEGRWIAFSSDRDGVPNLWGIGSEIRGSGSDAFHDPSGDSLKVKQLTRLNSGALFPSWTDSVSLLFTAFENYGFQIRELTGVSRVWDQASSLSGGCIPDSAAGKRTVWTYPRIQGTKESAIVRYRHRYSLDFAQSQVVQDPIYGTSGGGQVAISDLLGNEYYYFLVYNNARTRADFWDGFNVAATRVDLSRRVNHALGLYRLAGLYYNGYDGYFYEYRTGGFASVSYPLNMFERIETNLNIRYSEKEWLGDDAPRKAVLLSNFISYIKDNTLWGPSGPMDGARYRFMFGNTADIRYANVNFTTVIVDLRQYFRLGLRVCHAVRVWGQFNQGKEALPFALGGSWDLRGYKLWSIWGPKLVLVSNEFRFPFIDRFYLGFPFGGVDFSSIRGALFVDAGNAWEDRLGEWKGSFGFGIRFRLGGYLVLRLDVGRKTDFRSIEDRTFSQFFFGWDF
ncbi:PD40 domain-containing protein [bacterium]|nr:PD40 domain-containing protein [bacterium]